MKTLLYGGGAFATADDVADAVLELSLAIAPRGAAETVSVPVLHEGHTSVLSLILAPQIPVGVVTTSEPAIELSGSAESAAAIRGRAHAIVSPVHPTTSEEEALDAAAFNLDEW
jgi:hypothetical protein